jgi:hypothetical protein
LSSSTGVGARPSRPPRHQGGRGGNGIATLCGKGELESGAGAVHPKGFLLVERDGEALQPRTVEAMCKAN